MALNKIRIGDYVSLHKEKCNIPNLTPDEVSGINRDKEFFEPSKQVGKETSNYKVVPPRYFACNLMHIGRDVVLPIALNTTNKNKFVSPAYTVFKLKSENVILTDYLFVFLKSTEKDRYFWFHCDSSVRDGMEWNDFCDIELEIPSLEIQKKFVAIYEGLLANLRSYERGLADLKLVCDGYIEDLRKKYNLEEIKNYISEVNNKNNDGKIDNVLGISINGFIKPNQKPGDLKNYYVFSRNNIVYSPPRINVGSIGIYKENANAVCSPIYVIFKVKDEKVLNPDYLMIWLKRAEFLRSTDFYSIASVRNNFSYDLMQNVKICIPPLNIQNYIVNVHKSLIYRRSNVNKLKQIISSMCPILIRGSIEEANKEA